ncbi:leukocyte elastase inhibitor-like [Liolophura sinensis]|uniref:leukocyte elastase inhibitor-like n=1 Tax=Liolophura sinensis TaxID=3198878 RepID=UPI0031593992
MATHDQQRHTAAKAPVPNDLSQLTKSMAEFTRNLYNEISKQNPDENLFFSPFSIATALGMTLAGAKGNTASQIIKALKLTQESDDFHTAFQKLFGEIKTTNAAYTLSTANNMFVDQKFKVLDEYLKAIQSSFKSHVTNVNFAQDSEGSRSTINTWVDKETNSKIQDLIPSGVLTAQTVIVLVNAIYFKGNWARKFSSDVTHSKPFQLKNDKKIQVDMMYQKAKFPLGRLTELDCQILELPYVEHDLSMFILLPRRANGLTRLEESLTPAILQSVRSFVSETEVEVHLPKFKLEKGAELSNILEQLWIKDLFAEGVADLSGIDGTKDLYVSNVVHKAFIEVNEEGTEAVAASGFVPTPLCYTMPVQFNADHPFLFFIMHNRTGVILFIGRLSQPQESGKEKDEQY